MAIAEISKEYTFHAAHYLWESDDENCSNFHGHEYRARVVLKGFVDQVSGMIMNVRDLGEILKPLIKQLDHGIFVHEDDRDFIEFLKRRKWNKHTVLPYESTTENIARYILEYVLNEGLSAHENIHSVSVCLRETSKIEARVEAVLQ